ncbi:hypothetical protein HMPREF9441_02893 [Paraprevotella clara YIT 11840]|uniref:Uncharacterized protein n=1 Tax=Paraprevotella clara YIT 11840 TaxID=762968 RepID=G5SU38_9BACT|nr:hypothetical protein HMPREF9441_02893 [Paraprevotella clara YIT 11840]
MLMCKCNDFPVIKKDRKGIFPSISSILEIQPQSFIKNYGCMM